VGVKQSGLELPVNIYSAGSRIYISNLQTKAMVNIYSITGSLVKRFATSESAELNFNSGLWIVNLITEEGQKTVKVLTQ
jgi:hypothetical protein